MTHRFDRFGSDECATKTPAAAIPLDRASVNLPRLLDHALRPLRTQAAAWDVELVVRLAPDFPANVQVDGFKLVWAVVTLVGNALRYTRHGALRRVGGKVEVALRHRPDPGEIVLTVADDGPGIAPAALDRLLSRFLDDDRVPSLNLLLVEDVVRAHGGEVEIESATSGRRRGTTFTLRLPGI